MSFLNYFCKKCGHAWLLMPGCYTPQRAIPKVRDGRREAYIEVREDDHGNVFKTRYTRRAGYCYCGTAFPGVET